MREGGRAHLASAAAFAVMLTACLAGCLDTGLLGDVAFPAEVPGLPAGQPWVSLPVRSWLVEGDVQVRAISACFDPACRPQAAVAVLDIGGPDAVRLRAALDDPSALRRELVARALVRPVLRSGGRAPAGTGPGRPVPARIDVEGDGAERAGLSVRIARSDGSRAAFGEIALATRSAGRLTVILVIAPARETARSLARQVAARLS